MQNAHCRKGETKKSVFLHHHRTHPFHLKDKKKTLRTKHQCPLLAGGHKLLHVCRLKSCLLFIIQKAQIRIPYARVQLERACQIYASAPNGPDSCISIKHQEWQHGAQRLNMFLMSQLPAECHSSLSPSPSHPPTLLCVYMDSQSVTSDLRSDWTL